jgi:protocatechuate 3,4-dioxygenase beta subunit
MSPKLPRAAPTQSSSITRRDFALRVARGLAAVALGGGGAQGAAAKVDPADTCTLYPRQTEGPYYLDRRQLRRDITEGRKGVPLGLALQVVHAPSCRALSEVAVDVWHCDAAGIYSGYPGQLGGVDTRAETFLRGSQIADGGGRVRFDTVYPGWYPGRTTHVHFKVHVSEAMEATSQIYFPEDVTADVYARPAYAARGQKDTSNAADGVARARLPPLATVTREGAGYVATLTVAVAA